MLLWFEIVERNILYLQILVLHVPLYVYILWRKLGLLLVGITCLQSAAMLLTGKANWLQWGLWKDMLYTIFAQGVANLPAMKVWGLKKWSCS